MKTSPSYVPPSIGEKWAVFNTEVSTTPLEMKVFDKGDRSVTQNGENMTQNADIVTQTGDQGTLKGVKSPNFDSKLRLSF